MDELNVISPGPVTHYDVAGDTHRSDIAVVGNALKLEDDPEEEDMFDDFQEPEIIHAPVLQVPSPQTQPILNFDRQNDNQETDDLFDDFVEPENNKQISVEESTPNTANLVDSIQNDASSANRLADEASALLGVMMADLQPEIDRQDRLNQEVWLTLETESEKEVEKPKK